MPFYDSRPPEGWPRGSVNDMDYPLLGSICAISAIAIAGSGIWMLYRLDLGMGYSCKPYKSGRAPEVNSISGIVCLLCGTMYAAKSFDFFDGGGTPFSLNWYWYLDYVFTCPLLIVDFAFTLDIPQKLRYSIAVFVALWCAVAAFATPSAFRFAYYALGCCWFIPLSLFLIRDVKKRYQVYPPKCQRLLFWACVVFFGFWPLFPLLFIFSWQGSGHISRQAYYIIHAFLDLVCKSIFGFLMTFFRLELEEHTEVQGLPLKEPKVMDYSVASNNAREPAINARESQAVADANIKLQWIHKLLSEALAETSKIDLRNAALLLSSNSNSAFLSSTPEKSLSLRQRKPQARGEERAPYSLSLSSQSPQQKEERDALREDAPRASLSLSDSPVALRRASSRQRARTLGNSEQQKPVAFEGESVPAGGEEREKRHRRSLSRSSSSQQSPPRRHLSSSPGREREDGMMVGGKERERNERARQGEEEEQGGRLRGRRSRSFSLLSSSTLRDQDPQYYEEREGKREEEREREKGSSRDEVDIVLGGETLKIGEGYDSPLS